MTMPVLEITDVSKRFGDTLANDGISMALEKGEIVALLGENGAGKTTLMSILFGHYVPDTGHIRIDGEELPPGRPRAAIGAGVGMVHQHFSLAANLTVLENVMTGTERLWKLRSGTSEARKKLLGISERFGLKVDPDARLGDLSVGEQQRVEILKALYNDARILILDEPTAVLTNIEAERLFATLKDMARQGLSLIFISHKLDEVIAAADRIVVLRGGMAPVALGLVVGLAASFGVNRVLQSQLVGVSPYDPLTLTLAPLILIAVALLGCLLPLRRAVRVDPVVALKHD